MAIKITDKYEIDSDEYQYIVTEKRVAQKGKNEGEMYTKVIGYAGSITHALEIIYGNETKKWVKEHDATLSMAAKEFSKIAKEIKDYSKKFEITL